MDKDDGRRKGPINYEKQDDDNTLNDRESLSDSEEASRRSATLPDESNGNLNGWPFVFKRCVTWTCFVTLIALSLWIVFYPKPSHYVVDTNKTRGSQSVYTDFIFNISHSHHVYTSNKVRMV